MRWIFFALLVAAPTVARADASAPAPWAARCAAHFHAALAELRARHDSGDDGSFGEVTIQGRKVEYADEGGSCMNHHAFWATVEPARGGARRWRRSSDKSRDGAKERYHAELRGGGRRGTVDFSSNNESESAGASPGAFIEAFERAVELCLQERAP